MTDSKQSEGLPTAAEVKKVPGHPSSVFITKINSSILQKGDELVRRKDCEETQSEYFQEGHKRGKEEAKEEFKALIQDKYVTPLKEEIERIKGGVHELENPELVIEHHETQLENFEELLEELEKSDLKVKSE